MLTEDSFERVVNRVPDNAPFDHEQAWGGAPGGAWKFWQAVHRYRQTHPASLIGAE